MGTSFEVAKSKSRIAIEFHKNVCKLVWTHLSCIDKTSIPHIEIEMKFGVITDKKTHRRIIVPRNNPSIVQNRTSRLISNVSKKTFTSFQESFLLQPNNPSKSTPRVVQQIHTHTKDSIYNCKSISKSDKLASWRCSENLKSKELKGTYVKKIRIKDFLIHYPHSLLDAKISISLEVPQHAASAVFKDHPSILQRFKNRSTFCFSNKVPLHLDLTKVTTKRSGSSRRSTSHEVEIEMDPIFKEAVIAKDKEKFSEYMFLFLNTSDLIRKAGECMDIVVTQEC